MSWLSIDMEDMIENGLIKLGRGNVISKQDITACPGPFPIYSSASLNNGKFGEYGKYMFDQELITWSVDGGGQLFYRPQHKFSVTNVAGTLEVLDPSKLNCKFLHYVLKDKHSRLTFDWTRKAHPSVIRRLYKEIPLPPLEDQIRITHLLGKVEGLIAQRKQHLQQLDDLLKSVFLEMFGDPVRNEKAWKIEPLGKLASIERGRFSPRPRNDPKFFNGQYPFIQTGDISRSNGRLREFTQTLNELGIKVSKEFDVGTIVIAIVGATIGETAILEIPTYAPDSVIGIIPKVGVKKTEAVFIEFLLRFWKPVLRARAPEAARANINIETLRPLPVIRPEPEDRQKFAAIVEKVESLKSRYQKSLTDLENLYSALSQQAFKDELDLSRVPLPPDNDEAPQQAALTPEQQTASETFQLPEPPESGEWLSAENRQALIEFWLNAWFRHYVGQPFSAAAFIDAAYQRLLELSEQNAFRLDDPDHGLDKGQWYDEPAPFGTAEYEGIKQWVFDALAAGKLKQSLDANQIQIAFPKRPANWGSW